MQSHLSASKDVWVGGSLREVTQSTAGSHSSNFEPLAAKLWIEQFLNYLSAQLNHCLNAGVLGQFSSESLEALLVQTLINQLSNVLVEEVAWMEPATQQAVLLTATDAIDSLFVVRYTAANGLSSATPTAPEISLTLGTVTAETVLRRLQNREWQAAWQVSGAQNIIGWLIVSTTTSAATDALLMQLRSTLIERAIAQSVPVIQLARSTQQLRDRALQLQTQNQELTQISQLKSEFLANTSHEIRTPLSSILGFTHLLREQGFNPGSVRHQEYLKIILTSGQHLLALINDILDLSKIEANQLNLQPEVVDVLSLCQTVFKLVQEKANDNGLTLRLEVDSAVTTLIADPLRLKQMLFNLLSNALKFTTRGTIGLQVKQINNYLNFIVWDTGTGIPETQQALLFTPYTQLTNAVQGEGTGLGLALTQKLAELHGGWVKVQSELNQGSQFTVALPVLPIKVQPECEVSEMRHPVNPNEPALQPQILTFPSTSTPYSFVVPVKSKRSEPPSRSYNILLVEDNVHNARLVIIYLCKLGYEVTWVKNGSEMWQSLKQSLPALILMDVHLPDTDGLSLTKQLREAYRSVPVIAQTAMAMKGDRERCLAAGAVDYISKPIDLATLAQIVARYSGEK